MPLQSLTYYMVIKNFAFFGSIGGNNRFPRIDHSDYTKCIELIEWVVVVI